MSITVLEFERAVEVVVGAWRGAADDGDWSSWEDVRLCESVSFLEMTSLPIGVLLTGGLTTVRHEISTHN